MPDYTIVLSKSASKQLDGYTDSLAQPILEAISKLSTNPRPPGCKKLKGRDGY